MHFSRTSSLKRDLFIALSLTAIYTFNLIATAPAQAPPITSSGLNTQVSAPIAGGANGTTQFNISGGMRPGNGTNLFHSFGEFGVPANNIANFLNDSSLATSNILGRVTGGNPSNIFGTIQTSGFGSANLFLMNPAGIVFGPNASLNVGGSVSFTTADYLRLTDGARFTAIPGPQDAFISSAPVAAFGFLGSNPGAVTVQGGQLVVPEGQSISLVGGNITVQGKAVGEDGIQPVQLTAQGGTINLASAASPGEILYPTFQLGPNSNGQSFTNMGAIAASEGATLTVSANAAGTIKIRGGQFTLDRATISADTVNADGAPVAIDINVTGDLSISATDTPALTARTAGFGNAGDIRIQSDRVDISAFTEGILTVIDSHTSGTGTGGNVSLTTGDVHISGDPIGLVFVLDSGTTAEGSGGNVTITARSMTMQDSFISTGDAGLAEFQSSGRPGNISIMAEAIDLTISGMSAETFLGAGADITIVAHDIRMDASSMSAAGFTNSGSITMTGDRISLIGTEIGNQVVGSPGPGGDIVLTGKQIEVTGGTVISTSTLGNADAGALRINASDHFILAGSVSGTLPSSLASNSFGAEGMFGNAGGIIVKTPRLEVSGGARINTITRSSGAGGDVNIEAESIAISGQLTRTPITRFTALGNELASGILTSTIGDGTFCSGPCGDAGNVSITTESLSMGNGSRLDSGTTGSGRGGNIAISARTNVALSGTLSDGTPVGVFSQTVGTEPDSGQGGNISIAAGQSLSLGNGAAISAGSTGPANAGNIVINAGAQFLSQNAAVTTQARQASGGNITIQATDSIRLVNSQLSTSVQGGPNTVGGNILLDPAVVTLQNSQVTAQARDGQGGNINIVAGTFLADQTSRVSASSQFGLSGTVTIQSPVSSLSNTLATLTQRPLLAQNLLRQRCAAQVNGQLSSLVVSGRDALPTEPGGWLMSPLALMADDEPGPQAHVASTLIFEGHVEQSSDHHDSLSQRGVWDRETGCGS